MSSSQFIARELLDAYDHGQLIPSIVERDPSFDWDAAYDVAAEIVKLRRARGERSVGRKIGFTNRKIWAEYGATSPIWAHVYDSTLVSLALDRRRAYPIETTEIAKLVGQIRDCQVALKCNDEVKDRGVGSNALDHPAIALAFLADILARSRSLMRLLPAK